MVLLVATIVLVVLLTPRTTKSDVDEALPVLNPLESLSETPTPEEIKLAVNYLALEYGLDANKMLATLKCESSFRYDAKNPHSTASGVAQFIDSTWNNHCKGDKSSAHDQLICMSEFWANGEQHQWDCYQLLNF